MVGFGKPYATGTNGDQQRQHVHNQREMLKTHQMFVHYFRHRYSVQYHYHHRSNTTFSIRVSRLAIKTAERPVRCTHPMYHVEHRPTAHPVRLEHMLPPKSQEITQLLRSVERACTLGRVQCTVGEGMESCLGWCIVCVGTGSPMKWSYSVNWPWVSSSVQGSNLGPGVRGRAGS